MIRKRCILMGSAGILATTLAYPLVPFLLLESSGEIGGGFLERAGQFGDQFGALTALFTGLAFGGALVAILLQWQELKEAEQSRKEQTRALGRTILLSALSELFKQYSSPEMLSAIERLWRTRNDFPDDAQLIIHYDENMKQEQVRHPDEQRKTMHFQRRIVTQFYQMLGVFHQHEVIPSDIIFSNWSERDLRIIPKILVPIENHLLATLHKPPMPPLDSNSPLLRLYAASIEFERKQVPTPSPM